MHKEKVTKLEQQIFYLAQKKSKDQQAPTHTAKQRLAIFLFKKFFNIRLAQILAMALVLKPLHVSVQTQLCLTKALPRRFRGLASTDNLIKPATKGGRKKKRTPPPHCTRKQVFQLMRFSKQLRTIIVF